MILLLNSVVEESVTAIIRQDNKKEELIGKIIEIKCDRCENYGFPSFKTVCVTSCMTRVFFQSIIIAEKLSVFQIIKP